MEARAKRVVEKLAAKKIKNDLKLIQSNYDYIWRKVKFRVEKGGELSGHVTIDLLDDEFCILDSSIVTDLIKKLEADGFYNVHRGGTGLDCYLHVNWSIETCKK